MVELVSCVKKHFGPLAKGCDLCVLGRKSVIFVTGLCHYKCFYCPISDDKRGKDIVKVNEKVITLPDNDCALQDLFNEIIACQSLGASLTGGDPLAKLNRTCKYISALKNRFGEDFHIHLYTSLPFVSQDAFLRLEKAGLDELRFHVDLEDINSWPKMLFVEGCSFDVGIEIPIIPFHLEKTKELIYFAKQSGVINFINLNELEYSDVSDSSLIKRGMVVKDSLSYGIKGSEELAYELISFGEKIGLRFHYCSAGFKDGVQLANRLRLRAQKTAKEYDLVDEEGMITRGEIISNSNDVDLEDVRLFFEEQFDVPSDLMELKNNVLHIASWVLRELVLELEKLSKDKELGDEMSWYKHISFFIVTHYPTADKFFISREEL